MVPLTKISKDRSLATRLRGSRIELGKFSTWKRVLELMLNRVSWVGA